MEINLEKLKYLNIDTTITYDIANNTLGIISMDPVKIKGNIQKNSTVLMYDVAIKTELTMYDYNNFENITLPINIVFKENIEISEESDYIFKKTLDFSGKMWENIVVEIPSILSEYKDISINGNGWSYVSDDDSKQVIDERLKPLLQLLNEIEEV